MRLSNILLVLDAGRNCRTALLRAATLARNEHASLTVCTVVESIPPTYRRGIVVVTPSELMDLAVADTLQELQEFVTRENLEDLPVTTRVLVGKAHAEIAQQVLAYQFDLVIKSVKPLFRIGSRTFHRNDRKLMRTCPCPLWLVAPEHSDGKGPVLAALDLDPSDPVMSDISRTILKTSMALALAEFRELHVVHAWNTPRERRVHAGHPVAGKPNIHDIIASQSSDQIAIHYLAPTFHVINGKPREVVPDIANKLDASLLVIGTAARSGIAGFLTGNTSEKVLTSLHCSLLIVQPPGSRTVLTTPAWLKEQRGHSLADLYKSQPPA